MRNLIIVLFLFFLSMSFAVFAGQWYVVDSSKDVIATASSMPDEKDLESRNEFAVYSENVIPLNEADYKNKQIVVHEKTAKEIAADEKAAELRAREAKIQAKMRDLATKALEASGELEAE